MEVSTTPVEVRFENRTYEWANEAVAKSWEEWEANNLCASWGYTLPARAGYVADILINLIVFPWAILYVTCGTLVAMGTCDWQGAFFRKTIHYILERTNHICISALGLVSPGLAHKYRDANPGQYIAMVRIALLAFAGYKLLTALPTSDAVK